VLPSEPSRLRAAPNLPKSGGNGGFWGVYFEHLSTSVNGVGTHKSNAGMVQLTPVPAAFLEEPWAGGMDSVGDAHGWPMPQGMNRAAQCISCPRVPASDWATEIVAGSVTFCDNA
jgi:hypothetical protein